MDKGDNYRVITCETWILKAGGLAFYLYKIQTILTASELSHSSPLLPAYLKRGH